VHSETQCCANLAQGGGFLGAFRVPGEDSALCKIRATTSREKAGRLTGSALLRVSVSPAKRVVAPLALQVVVTPVKWIPQLGKPGPPGLLPATERSGTQGSGKPRMDANRREGGGELSRGSAEFAEEIFALCNSGPKSQKQKRTSQFTARYAGGAPACSAVQERSDSTAGREFAEEVLAPLDRMVLT
jgi:hypothetical protein